MIDRCRDAAGLKCTAFANAMFAARDSDGVGMRLDIAIAVGEVRSCRNPDQLCLPRFRPVMQGIGYPTPRSSDRLYGASTIDKRLAWNLEAAPPLERALLRETRGSHRWVVAIRKTVPVIRLPPVVTFL